MLYHIAQKKSKGQCSVILPPGGRRGTTWTLEEIKDIDTEKYIYKKWNFIPYQCISNLKNLFDQEARGYGIIYEYIC